MDTPQLFHTRDKQTDSHFIVTDQVGECMYFPITQGLPRRTFYYQSKRRARRVNDALAARIKRVRHLEVCGLSHRGVAPEREQEHGERIFQLKGWQVGRRRSGHRPRVQSLPLATSRSDERWATDIAPLWCVAGAHSQRLWLTIPVNSSADG